MQAPAACSNAVAEGLAALASSRPDTEALRDDTQRYTYAQADALAGTIAHRILQAGDDQVVPVIADRSAGSVLAVHGVLRSGRAFAVIDSDAPHSHVLHVLDRLDNPATAVVARPELADRLPERTTAICATDPADDPIPPQPVADDDLAFVIFTSGSTGQPKGVMHSWATLSAMLTRRRIRHAERGLSGPISLTTTLTFIAGLTRLLQLAIGVPIVVRDTSMLEPADLLEWYDTEGFESIAIVPSRVTTLRGHWPTGRRLEQVKRVTTYGEALTWEHVAALRALIPHDAVIDAGYGASECPGAAIRFTVTSDLPIGNGRVPLGVPSRPETIRLAPWGDDPNDPCELWLSGNTAIGYLGQPDLTAERFVTDDNGVRWWRSGDLVTQDPTGVLVHQGRVDEMVKINGKLVEPAEAERVIRSIDGVLDTVVLPHSTTTGRLRLVGHVAVDPSTTLRAGQVHARLNEQLPSHTRPSALVRHATLPLTPRGKIDRALLRSKPIDPWRDAPRRRPVGGTEWFVVGQASKILDLDVGPDDDLWQLGLDSLAAVELAAILTDAGYGEIDPTSLVSHPTPTQLAAQLAGAMPERQSIAVTFNPEGARDPLFIVPGAGESALVYRSIAQELGDAQPLVVLEAHGMHVRGRPDRTIEAMAQRAVAEIASRISNRPCLIAGHSAGGSVAYEVGHLLADRGNEVHVVLFDAGTIPEDGPRSDLTRLARRTRGRAVTRLPRAALQRALFEARIRVGARLAGRRPARTLMDYRAFGHIGRRAMLRYRPREARFPVTMIQPHGSRAVQRWERLVPDLEVHEVGGDHRSMVEHPHASEVAALLGRARE